MHLLMILLSCVASSIYPFTKVIFGIILLILHNFLDLHFDLESMIVIHASGQLSFG